MELPKRKSIRLKDYDYSQNGAYFVTIYTYNRECLFGDIVGDGVLDVPRVILSDYGVIVKNQIEEMVLMHIHLDISKYVIMPNHIHLIIIINEANGTSRTPSPIDGNLRKYIMNK